MSRGLKITRYSPSSINEDTGNIQPTNLVCINIKLSKCGFLKHTLDPFLSVNPGPCPELDYINAVALDSEPNNLRIVLSSNKGHDSSAVAYWGSF
jgi:hypothetical protein